MADSQQRCTVCFRPVTFGRKSAYKGDLHYCGLCEAKRKCQKLGSMRTNKEPGNELPTKYGELQASERIKLAWDWLWKSLCERSMYLNEDRVNDIVLSRFEIDCWEFYANLVNENKVYFILGEDPRICLHISWKPSRYYSGSFEGGRR